MDYPRTVRLLRFFDCLEQECRDRFLKPKLSRLYIADKEIITYNPVAHDRNHPPVPVYRIPKDSALILVDVYIKAKIYEDNWFRYLVNAKFFYGEKTIEYTVYYGSCSPNIADRISEEINLDKICDQFQSVFRTFQGGYFNF